MTEFHGVIRFTRGAGHTLPSGVGRHLTGAGLERPRRWHDDRAELAAAQRIVTREDEREFQPQADGAGCVTLFDGYLYDREALAAGLGLAIASPDSVLAAQYLARHGSGLEGLRGDYALARWDPTAARLTLGVAPMAVRMLYFHLRPGEVRFATSLANLHCLGDVPREIDAAQLALQLVFQLTDPAATLFRDIEAVPPGALVELSGGAVTRSTIWRPDPSRRIRLKRDADYAEAARDLLNRAVARSLRGLAPPACALSGGLDSSAVAATAARLMPGESLDCYTAVPAIEMPDAPRHYSSERPLVTALAARHANLHARFFTSEGMAGFEDYPEALMNAGGRLVINLSHLGWFDPAFRAAAADGHKAMLTGQSGNFTLSFDGLRALGDLARQGRVDLLARWIPPVARHRGMSKRSLIRSAILVPMLPPRWRDRIARLRQGAPAWTRLAALRPDFARDVALEERLWDAGLDAMFAHEPDSRRMAARFLEVRRVRSVENFRSIGAYYGMEFRDPLADPELVDFCLAIPREQYLLGGEPRSLARRALADRLPPELLGEQRAGRQNPEWFARLSRQRARYAEEIERLEAIPLAAQALDLPRLKRLIDRWPQSEAEAHARRFEYEQVLRRGVEAGRFIRWVSGSNQ